MLDDQNVGSKIVFPKKVAYKKKDDRDLYPNRFRVQKLGLQKIFCVETILGPQKLRIRRYFGSKNIFGH